MCLFLLKKKSYSSNNLSLLINLKLNDISIYENNRRTIQRIYVEQLKEHDEFVNTQQNTGCQN